MIIKKQICILVTAALSATGWLAAGPLVKSEIAKDAKWLAHIDMEGVMKSSFSDLGVAKLKIAIEEANESKLSIDVEMILKEIKSLTAYGASFSDDADKESVIILKTGNRLQAIFDGMVAHQEMEEGQSPLKRIEGKPYETFLLQEELYVAFPHKNYAIASKNFDRIEKAYAVIDGKADSLEKAGQKLILNEESGFFLMITAKGIDGLKNVPPQARMLQKTKGGQISIGEMDGELRANVMLTTADREVSLQLYRIVQGMLALASFTQVENQSLMEVVDSVDVRQGDDFVSLNFAYPMEKIMSLIGRAMDMIEDDGKDDKGRKVHSSATDGAEKLAPDKLLALSSHDQRS